MTDKPDLWTFCPECGTTEVHYEEGRHHFCRCGQEWFSDLNYSSVISANLGKWMSERDESRAEVKRLRDALAHFAVLGCSDGNCMFRDSKGGQHTNGGCRCLGRSQFTRREKLGELIEVARVALLEAGMEA